MDSHNFAVGKIGEEIARNRLASSGYEIIGSHVTLHWGEIDIIARKGRSIHFIEVKTRIGTRYGKPYEAVTPAKIRSLRRAIDRYLLKSEYKAYKLSLDVVSIVLKADMTVEQYRFFENINS